MSLTTLTVAAAASLLVLSPSPDEAEPAPRSGDAYTLILTRKLPTTHLTEEERRTALGWHLTRRADMSNAGDLLLTGYFVEPKLKDDLKLLLVIDRPTLAEGLELVSDDEALRSAVLAFDVYEVTCEAPLRELLRIEKELDVGRRQTGESPVRPYMVAVAPFDRPVYAKVREFEGVAVAAIVHEWEEDGDAMVLVLDATTAEEAMDILPDWVGWELQEIAFTHGVGLLRDE